ncbi:ATP-dependent nuclease [Geotalea uraniireducens]|nr:AAA family ATPase [Geotalea uraniireducens]
MPKPLVATSGVKVTDVRIANFRSLMDIEVSLDSLTVLIGANNAGKTSFLDAIYAAIGAGRKLLGQDDIRVAPEEAIPPKDRNVVIDIKIRPITDDGKFADEFPEGSFWTSLWGSGITPAETDDSHEFMAFRTILSWSFAKGDYVLERKFLKEWRPYAEWLPTPMQEKRLQSSDIEPIALHYIDAKRDLDDDLRKQGSFWRKLTDDLGLSPADIIFLEEALTGINQHIVDKSEILKHLKHNLADMQSVVAAEGAGIDISPVARRLRDLSKGIDVSFSTTAAQSFPLTRHGMGTRSLASLLVFRAFASWRSSQAQMEGDQIHTFLALEEPESHLHPQAQRSLFSHIKTIPGQRIVSTHSPYFAGQAQLSDLRLFLKRGGNTIVTQLDISQLGTKEDLRKLQQTVVDTRGDLLFSRAVIFFEGQTEEQALPIWAEKYWNASIHELGFSFVRVNGTDYFPFISLAQHLEIPWYVLADGEPRPLGELNKALKKIGQVVASACPNIVVFPNGNNFESQFLAEGYLPEIEKALNETHNCTDFLGDYINELQGQKRKGGEIRDYTVGDGRKIAALDALNGLKTCMAKPLAHTISSLPDEARRFPNQIRKLFEIISSEHGLTKAKETT